METLNKRILVALLDMAQNDIPASVNMLSLELGETRARVADCLNHLALEDLVNPETMRLTFVGLMHATGLRARLVREELEKTAAA